MHGHRNGGYNDAYRKHEGDNAGCLLRFLFALLRRGGGSVCGSGHRGEIALEQEIGRNAEKLAHRYYLIGIGQHSTRLPL